MGRVICDISMSLDGFVAGPDHSADELRDWVYGRQRRGPDGGGCREAAGAVILGRRMFDVAGGWGDDPLSGRPVFVLTSRARASETGAGGATYTFVTGGVESALAQARAAAGDRDVSVLGGPHTVQQFIRARLLDELRLHIAPVLMGEGVRLFDRLGEEQVGLESTRVIDAPEITHLTFRFRR